MTMRAVEPRGAAGCRRQRLPLDRWRQDGLIERWTGGARRQLDALAAERAVGLLTGLCRRRLKALLAVRAPATNRRGAGLRDEGRNRGRNLERLTARPALAGA